MNHECSVTCEEGLDPACPLPDLLSFPSLFFLPLDTLADSLSARGTLSVGTKAEEKAQRLIITVPKQLTFDSGRITMKFAERSRKLTNLPLVNNDIRRIA